MEDEFEEQTDAKTRRLPKMAKVIIYKKKNFSL